MPHQELPLIFVTQRLDGELRLGEALWFPEVMAMHEQGDRLGSILRRLVKEILSEAAPIDVHRRMAGQTPAISQVLVSLKPAKKSVAWTESIDLRFDVLRWQHGQEGWIGFVPALGIQVVAAREEQLDELIPRHIRVALARTRAAERLFDLVQLERVESVTAERETIAADIRTPTELADDRSKKEEAAKLVIDEVGVVLDDKSVAEAYEIEAVVDRLAESLAGRNPRSVLLVGPSGAGKTAAFGQLFLLRRLHRLGHAPFWATSGARLIAGASGFGLWQERCQKLCRQAKRDGAILHLGNLVELMEVGKAGGSHFGIANFFRPFLARGDILAVAECTPEQLPIIERSNPHLLAAFEQIAIEEPAPKAVLEILSRAAEDSRSRCADDLDPRDRSLVGPLITPAGLDAVARLHRRYATYSASPGRPLRFLKNLLQDQSSLISLNPGSHDLKPIGAPEVTAAFSRETGLPLFLLDEAARLDLAAARGYFAGRVIGQGQAVDLVTDLLASVKAALNRPRRPIASLLFIGPTGVGKTEMAKALADYFFGGLGLSSSSILHPPSSSSSPRLLRFDMSEYATPDAVARLVGTAWESEGLLTSKVREQPFCVLLLDEFEKAHPSFFDLLLQILGEGRLTDSAGRLADFSNAIVVMTSNLGAASFGSGPFGLARATTTGAVHAHEHFTHAVRSFLRPELFNRIDRIVPFLPLDESTIRMIARREVELISQRDGVRRRNLRLDISPAALDHLAKAGYDELYGVRPLKRQIEKELLAPLADAANQYAPATSLVARVDVSDGRLGVVVRAANTRQEDRGSKTEGGAEAGNLLPSSILHSPSSLSSMLRRRLQAIARCPAAMALGNELFSLQRNLERKELVRGRAAIEPAARERLRRLKSIHDMQSQLGNEIVGLEDALLLNLYEAAPLPAEPAEISIRMDRIGSDTQRLLLELYSLGFPDPHGMTLGIYANAPMDLFTLAQAYRDVAVDETGGVAGLAGSASVSYYTREGKNSLIRRTVEREDIKAFFSQPRSGVIGIVVAIRAAFARPRFETESGLHVIEEEKGKNPHPILVDAMPVALADYRPPKDVEFRIALAGQRRRTYTRERQEIEDSVTGKSYRWTGREFSGALGYAMEENLRRRVEGMIET
jgi:ATP-dependent Clp protease ATP-binding subunit ClpC